MIRFAPPAYPGGRHCLMCGNVPVGSVSPPVGHPPGEWTWRLWIHPPIDRAPEGRAKDETSAKHAALTAFTDFLKKAQLAPVKEAET